VLGKLCLSPHANDREAGCVHLESTQPSIEEKSRRINIQSRQATTGSQLNFKYRHGIGYWYNNNEDGIERLQAKQQPKQTKNGEKQWQWQKKRRGTRALHLIPRLSYFECSFASRFARLAELKTVSRIERRYK